MNTNKVNMMSRLLAAFLFALGSGLTLAAPISAQQDPFQKLNAKGEPMPVTAGPWLCVQDKRTGLVWENKSDNPGWRLNTSTYSWMDAKTGQGAALGGVCEIKHDELVPCDTATLIQVAKKQAWCGREDWRLPSAAELRGLIFDTRFSGEPMIATGYFQHTGRSAYWTADIRFNEQGETEALGIRFSNATEVWLPLTRTLRTRLVAGPQAK